jgi:hypothetical protein
MSLWRSPLLYFGILLILAAAAALAAPLYIDWGRYRADIEDVGRQLTGRKVTIGDKIEARLFPWPVLWLNDVTVDNPPGAKFGALMRARQIEARLALAPLISGKFVVEGIRVDQPVFAFERLATGVGTWQLEPRVALTERVSSEAVAVSGIEIIDGTIILADGRRGGAAKISDVDAEVSASTLAGPWRFKGAMSYAGDRKVTNITTGKIRHDEPVRFSVRIAPETEDGVVYTFDGILGDQQQGVTGKLKVQPSHTESRSADGPPAMVLKSDVDADFDTVKLNNVEIAPDDVTDAGNLLTGSAVVELGSVIRLHTILEAGKIDVDEMTSSRGHEALFSGEAFPLIAEWIGTLPRQVEGDVQLSVTSLLFGGELLDGFKLHAEIEKDRLKINTLEASMPGQTRGRFVGSFLPDGFQSQLAGDIELNSISLRDFVKWVAISYRQDIERVWSGARGRLALKGKLDATSYRTRLTEGEFSFDDAKGVGNFLVSGGDAPALSARLVVDTINIDRYAPGGLTNEAVDDGLLAGALDLAGKAMQAGDFGLKLQADFLTLHGVTGEDIAVDVAANADGIEFRTVEIGKVGDARLDVAGLLSFPETGVSGAVRADIKAKDPRGLLRLLGIIPSNVNAEPAWVGAVGPVDLEVTGEAKAAEGVTDGVVTMSGQAGAAVLDATGRFKGDHKNWTKGSVHASGNVAGKSARSLAALLGVRLYGEGDSAVRLTGSVTGEPAAGMALTAEVAALEAQAQFAGTLALDPSMRALLDGRLAVLAERSQLLYRSLGLLQGDLGPVAQVLSGEGALNFSNGQWNLSGLSGTAAGTAYRGDLGLDWTGERARLLGIASAGSIDLQWLLGLGLVSRETALADGALSFSSDDVLPFDVDLKLETNHLATFPGLDLKKARLSLAKAGEAVEVSVEGKNASDRDVSWNARFERRELELAVEGGLKAEFELEKHLLTDKGAAPLGGVIAVEADFTGAGRSPSGLLSALAGNGKYHLKTPSLAPLDPVGFSSGLAELDDANGLDRLIETRLFAGRMPFTGASGELTIENGVVRFSKIPLSAEGATGHVTVFGELGTGNIDISTMVQLDAVKGLPAFEVALAGAPAALETTRDLTAVKSYIGVNVLQKGLDKLEELQREADRLFRDEMNFAREQVKEQLQREADRKAREEEERRKADEERLRREIETRELAEAEARRLAEELEKRKIEEQAREMQRELERQLAEEEAKRLAEQAKSRTRLEKHIRRVEDNPNVRTVPKQEPVPEPAPVPEPEPQSQPTTQLNVEPPPVPREAPEIDIEPSAPTIIAPQVFEPQPEPANVPQRPRTDR